MIAASVAAFRPVYVRGGAPRLAIYWNREVSDRISQWATEHRRSVSGQLETVQGGGVTRQLTGEAVTLEQRPASDASRETAGESWDWEFQEGFLYPFLQAGARIVDRATIIRLTAVQAGGRVGAERAQDVQAIETMALQGFADVLIEVLVGPPATAAAGRDLRATVKDVRSGLVLAYVTSRSLRSLPRPRRVYVATPQGFEPREIPPPVREIASHLALGVMDALAAQWGR